VSRALYTPPPTLATVVDNEMVEVVEESDHSEVAKEEFGLEVEVAWLDLVYHIKPACQ